MSLTNKVLYDIDQRNDTTPTQKETARKNIGAYEDKTTAGGGTGIPKADLASDVQSSLGKADSSVQSVTSNGQALTKSAAGAIDIPKATDTKWGVVQVVEQLMDNKNVIPNSQVVKQAVDGLKEEVNALKARATFWTVQEWQTQSAQPGDASKIYYVGPKGTGRDQYDMYEWRSSSQSYVLTDESTISLDGYWHGAPDIVCEDTVAPFITSIEKKADDTVKYRTCSATVGDLGLPVFMDSGVVKPIDLDDLFPIVRLTTPYEVVRDLVERGYRPILLPYDDEYGERYQITDTISHYSGPEYIFTAIKNGSAYLPFFSDKKIRGYSCQNIDSPEWKLLNEHLLPVIPEPNESGLDIGKVLTVSAQGRLYWEEPAGGNNVEVRAGTNNLHVTSADVNDKTIFTMSADYYHSSGNYAGTYTGPGTVIVDPTTMNLESTNSAYGYREEYREALIGSNTTATWNMEWMASWSGSNIPTNYDYRLVKFSCRGTIRDDMRVHIKFSIADSYNEFETKTLYADDLRKETYLAIPTGAGKIEWQLGSDSSPSGYADCGYNIYVYAHSDNTRYMKGELAWKDQTYHYVDEQIETREPRLPVHSYSEQNKILVVSGDNGELGWMPHTELPETSGSQYLIGDNGTVKWRDREKLVYQSSPTIAHHTVTQEDLDAKIIDMPLTSWNIPSPGIPINYFILFLVIYEAGYTRVPTGHPILGDVSTLSVGYWNDDYQWYGGDLMFEAISGSDLPYGDYGHGPIRRTGIPYSPNSSSDLYKMRGPSIRLNLASNNSLILGDKISIKGAITGIRIDGGLW